MSATDQLPWRLLTPRQLAFVRHRMAGYTTCDIAAAYGVLPGTVRYHLGQAVATVRRPWLRLSGITDLLVLAAFDGVERLPLPGHRLANASDAGADGT